MLLDFRSKLIRRSPALVSAYLLLYLAAGFVLPVLGRAEGTAEIWKSSVRHFLNRDYPRTISLLGRFLGEEKDPAKLSAGSFLLGEACRLSGNRDQAALAYRRVAGSAAGDPLQVSARLRLAESAFNQEKFEEAEGLFRALAQDPAADFILPQVRLSLVKTYLKLSRVTAAQKIFGELLATYPRALLDPEIKFLFGLMKEYQGQTLDALKIYQELEEDPLAQLFAGVILEAQGRYLPAVEAYNRVRGPAARAAWRELASVYKVRAFYKAGDYLAADKLCQQFLPVIAGSARRSQLTLLRLLIWQAQARFESVLDLGAREENHRQGLEPEDRSLWSLVLGDAALNLDRLEMARAHYQNARRPDNQTSPEVLWKLALTHLLLGQGREAYDRCQDYLRSAAAPEPLAQLVFVRAALAIRQETEAFRAVQTLAHGGESLAELGWYYLADHQIAGKNTAAVLSEWAVLEKYLEGRPVAPELRPVAAWSRLLLGEAHFQQGDYRLAAEAYGRALELYPRGEVEALAAAGQVWCAFRRQDYGTAAAKAQRLIAANKAPASLADELSLLIGHAAFNQQDYPSAIQAYADWLRAHPTSPRAPSVAFQLGWAHYLNKGYLDAIETWKDLTRDHPQSDEAPQALYWIADTYFQAGENAQARGVYLELLRRGPEAPDAKAHALRVAQTYYNEQNDGEAIRRFMEIMERYPGTDEAREAGSGIEAATYRITDRLNDIGAFREFIAKHPGSALAEDIQYRIGEAYFQKGQPQESLQEFLQFIVAYTKSPRTPNAQYYIAVCQEQLGNTLAAVQQAAAFVNNYPQHELAAEMLFRTAANEFLLERYADAAAHFAACAENYPLKEYQPRAFYNAAVTYEKLEMPDLAVQYYQRLTAEYPQDPNTAIAWSRVALLQAARSRPDEVEAAMRELDRSSPADLRQKTWLNLAAYYQESGEAARREEALKALLSSGPTDTETYSLALVDLASVYEQRKAWAQAIPIYQKLIKTTGQKRWRDAAKKRITLLQRLVRAGKAQP